MRRCRRRGAHSRSRGVSLVELMVVVAIAAVLAVVAAPAFQELIVSQRVRSVASALQDSLRLARSEAIKRNRAVAFTINEVDLSWAVTLADDATTVLRREGATSGVSVKIVAGTGQLEYNSQGRLAAGGLATQLELEGPGGVGTRCIRFDNAARAQTTKGACA